MARSLLVILVLLSVAGCGEDVDVSDGGPDAGPGGDVDAGARPVSEDPCDRIAGGAPSSAAVPVALSEAHARNRFFGLESNVEVVDVALAEALRAPSAPGDRTLDRYSDALPGACAVDASVSALGPAELEVEGTRARLRVGAGAVPALPAEVDEVLIDLRGLSESPELDAALRAALSAVLTGRLDRLDMEVRGHVGMTDEAWAPALGFENVYSSRLLQQPVPEVIGEAGRERSLAVLTDATLPPTAARYAGWLRLAGLARIAGEDVFAVGAESRWAPVGSRGLVFRDRNLRFDGARWPDRIPADLTVDEAETSLAVRPLGPVDGAASRAALEPLDAPSGSPTAATVDLGVARASVIITHGAARLFYPMFHIVGDRIDARLLEVLETLASAEVVDRALVSNVLRRFLAAIDDGHAFVFNRGGGGPDRFLPLHVDAPAGTPFVRSSEVEGIEPGDQLLRIGDERAEDWFARRRAITSAATESNGTAVAWLGLQSQREASVRLTVQGPGGSPREVEAPTRLVGARGPTFESRRGHGRLTDLGAPEVHYINLDGASSGGGLAMMAALADAQGARGIVLDMRGYPDGGSSTEERLAYLDFLATIAGGRALSPRFFVPTYEGLDTSGVDESQYDVMSRSPALVPSVPIALLVGPLTQSQAEDVSMYFLSGDTDITVVGRTSSGTDGNITGVRLPGAFSATFTGMEVRTPEGARFHGVGLVPDREVLETRDDFAAGVDRALLEAIAAVSG